MTTKLDSTREVCVDERARRWPSRNLISLQLDQRVQARAIRNCRFIGFLSYKPAERYIELCCWEKSEAPSRSIYVIRIVCFSFRSQTQFCFFLFSRYIKCHATIVQVQNISIQSQSVINLLVDPLYSPSKFSNV